jgi:hypothetical protein
VYEYNAGIYGGVYNLNNAYSAAIDNCKLRYSYAKYGGSIYAVDGTSIEFTSSEIDTSFALLKGGSIMISR